MTQTQSSSRKTSRKAFGTLALGSAFVLLLSACESNGGARFASVGPSPGSGGGGSDGGSGSGSGGGSSNNGGTGGTGGTGGSGGSGGSGDAVTAALGQLSPVLVTAGNAVLGVSDGQNTITTPIATALPVARPLTGTITRVLNDTGTVLVDAGAGRSLLLEGTQGVVGDLVSIDVGGRTVTNGLDGTAGAIGTGLLGNSQPEGTIATVGVLNAGNTALASVNGIADVRITNITSPTGGISDNLLNVALGGNQLLGGGNPALVNANILPNGVGIPGAGAGAGGNVLGAVEGLTAPVQQVAGGLLAPLGVGADAGAAPGGVLAPVTGVVTGTVGALGGGLGLLGR